MATVAVGFLSDAWAPSTADAVVNGRKYSYLRRHSPGDYDGIYAGWITRYPTIRDDPDTASIIQHWIGEFDSTKSYVETGWVKRAGQPSEQWWGWTQNGEFSGYQHAGWPPDGATYFYKIAFNYPADKWEVWVGDSFQGWVESWRVPPPGRGMPVHIMTGGEVHYGNSPFWNQMGPVTTGVMTFKRAAQWQPWYFNDYIDRVVGDWVDCTQPGGGYYNFYAAAEGRDVWGCLDP